MAAVRMSWKVVRHLFLFQNERLFTRTVVPIVQRPISLVTYRFFSKESSVKDNNQQNKSEETNGREDAQLNTEPDPYAPFPDGINPETGERDGPKGPEPTRYGDWERKGRCIDF